MSNPSLARLDAAVVATAALTRDRIRTGISHDDANAVDGTIATDGAIDFDPRPLLRALFGTGAELLIIGQIAGILHGSKELTGDLDLIWRRNRRFAHALASVFNDLGATFLDTEDRPIPVTADSVMKIKVNFHTAGASGDLCTPELWSGSLPVNEYFDRSLSRNLDGIEVRYLDATDLIGMRNSVRRPKDLRRNAELDAILARPCC